MVKVYTRTGDDGTTHCFRSGRIPKDDGLIEAIGTVDELNAHLGFLLSLLRQPLDLERDSGARSQLSDRDLERIQSIQDRLFDLGGALATLTVEKQFSELVSRIDEAPLETWIDQMDTELPEIRQFILPGGSIEASQAHICRTNCRRAERQVVAVYRSLREEESQSTKTGLEQLIKYLNRLSDCLFVLARYLNKRSRNGEIFWKNENQESAQD